MRATGAVACWDRFLNTSPQDVTGVTDAVEVKVAAALTCVKRASGVIRCWDTVNQPADVPGLVSPTRFFGSNGDTICALRADGYLACTDLGAPFQPLIGFEGP
ncbi:hypothetical protein BH09MYX1_BH09MYX1_28360 [soil metagenome]